VDHAASSSDRAPCPRLPLHSIGGVIMSALATATFRGFRPEAIQFLADLAANNDRAWFQPRKAEYESLLKEPLAALCTELAERFAARGVPLSADPIRSPFRIYRDIRFSRDKSPYKTHLGASFPWAGDARSMRDADRETRHGVGGYFHFAPGDVYVGGGMWHPEPARLAAFRRTAVEHRGTVRAALEEPRFVAEFGKVSGDSLKRVPAGYDPFDPDADLLRLKDVVFGRRLSDDDALSPELPEIIAESLRAAVPVLRLLAGLRAA
jgi:uncharacterized protein (TIGR02453 family)